MYWLDWIIICIPLVVVLIIGLKAQKYVKTVADFLAAGRVAGRYVICVASGEAGMGLISLVAIWEMYYKCGFAVGFWSSISAPLGLFLSLTGYCTYRYRETRAMTMGQYFEMRYNRPFRIYPAVYLRGRQLCDLPGCGCPLHHVLPEPSSAHQYRWLELPHIRLAHARLSGLGGLDHHTGRSDHHHGHRLRSGAYLLSVLCHHLYLHLLQIRLE